MERGAFPSLNQRIGTSQQNKHHAALPNPTEPNSRERAATQYHSTTISDLDGASQ